MAGLVWKKANSYGAWASIIGSASVWIIMEYLYISLPLKMLSYLTAGFVLLIGVTFITSGMSIKDTNYFYKKLRIPVRTDLKIDEIK
jgi:Na+/proline symporter